MTLDKAIEYLTYLLKEHPRIESADFGSAIKLGIEALNRLQVFRNVAYLPATRLLPGEDEA